MCGFANSLLWWYRSLETKGLQRILPKGGAWGFFGWHTVPVEPTNASNNTRSRPIPTSIIITEGEYDAMAVADAITTLPPDHPFAHIPAVSLPNGCNSLPVDLIPLVADFEKIYLYLDHDKSGQDACGKFIRKLGSSRCVTVSPSHLSSDHPLLKVGVFCIFICNYKL